MDLSDLEYFKATYGLRDSDVQLIPYGSRVYGTHSDQSDYDYIAIVPPKRFADTGTTYEWNKINVHIYNRYDFQKQLERHKIHALEAYYYPGGFTGNFKLDLSILRTELSEKASHSFVKAKKKIDKEKDYYVGWKSLFHSLRILNFGIQIAKHNQIKDYGAANHLWFEIRDAQQYNWEYFKNKYQPIFNSLATDFRKVAPK